MPVGRNIELPGTGRQPRRFCAVVELHVNGFEPQAMYWAARADEHSKHAAVGEQYARVCQRVRPQLLPSAGFAASRCRRSRPGLDADRPVGMSRTSCRRIGVLELKTCVSSAGIEPKVLELWSRCGTRIRGAHGAIQSGIRMSCWAFSTMLSEVELTTRLSGWRKCTSKDKLERSGSRRRLAKDRGSSHRPGADHCGARCHGSGSLPGRCDYPRESQYEKAVSRGRAVGLMKMPVTATVAQRVFPHVGRLFDQGRIFARGSAARGQLLEQYGGNLAHAVAAYNAGPIAVNGWIAVHRGREQDEFVELIYQETRSCEASVAQLRRISTPSITGRRNGAPFSLTRGDELLYFAPIQPAAQNHHFVGQYDS